MSLIQQISEDIRFHEALKSCMNCGVCTAICPAAEFHDYDPRVMITAVQSRNENQLEKLLSEDTIWLCGQCMSCKMRCPGGNFPGLMISVLRKYSQETGKFTQSRLGRQQYAIRKTIGENILKLGYCVHPSAVLPELHPEQGPVWDWIFKNPEIYDRFDAVIGQETTGTLRKIADKNLDELKAIFDVTGGTEMFELIEKFSLEKMKELGFSDDQAGIDDYFQQIYSGNEKNVESGKHHVKKSNSN